MDPLYASSVLSSAERQVTDARWPATNTDREMVRWSPGNERPIRRLALTISRATVVTLTRIRSGLGRLAPASNV
jgi:hypothetical protein